MAIAQSHLASPAIRAQARYSGDSRTRISRPKDQRCQEGYTLIEMLITTGLIALILSIVNGGSLTGLIDHNRRQVTVRQLTSLVQFARAEAVSRQTRVRLCAVDENETCTIDWRGREIVVFDDRDGNKRASSGETLRRHSWPADRGRLEWRASLGRRFLEFSAMGSTAQNGSFLLCQSDRDDRADVVMTINRGGRLYLNSGAARTCR